MRRTLKLSALGVLLIGLAALVTDTLDFCTAEEDGTIRWDPHVSTAAVRKYGAVAWNIIAPREIPGETEVQGGGDDGEVAMR